jgi:putative copper export protein
MFHGVTPPRMTRMLDPQKLVDKIVVATRRGDTWLLEPFMVKLTPVFRLLPTRVLDALARFFGVATSMKAWQGH